MSEKTFVKGMFIEDAKPDFVVCKVSVKCEEFYEFMKTFANEKGYVNIDVLRSKTGKPYAALNEWKPSAGGREADNTASFGNYTPQTAAKVTAQDEIPF